MYSQTQNIIQFQSTAHKNIIWKIWHFCNYILGGITFLIGSFLYYPYFTERGIDSNLISGWLYTIGSTGFLLADLTQWNHYRFGCFPCETFQDSLLKNLNIKQLGINFFISAIGSFLYLLGSIYFIPATNNIQLGQILFIVGSTFIYCSQGWKCYRSSFGGTQKSILKNINMDLDGFLVDFFAGIGGVFYFIGTFIFHKSQTIAEDYNSAITLFTLGGSSFFLSGVFIFKRYFCLKNQEKNQKREQLITEDKSNATSSQN